MASDVAMYGDVVLATEIWNPGLYILRWEVPLRELGCRQRALVNAGALVMR